MSVGGPAGVTYRFLSLNLIKETRNKSKRLTKKLKLSEGKSKKRGRLKTKRNMKKTNSA